jgi:hypothetical protein
VTSTLLPICSSALSETELRQACIIDAKVMGDLMDNRRAHLLHELFLRNAYQFDGLLEDKDAIRQRVGIVRPASCLRNAMVKAKKQRVPAGVRLHQTVRRRPPFNDDVNVFQTVKEFRRKAPHCAPHKAFEVASRDVNHSTGRLAGAFPIGVVSVALNRLLYFRIFELSQFFEYLIGLTLRSLNAGSRESLANDIPYTS